MRAERFQWSVVRDIMTRPQPVTIPMVLLFAIIPGYLVIAGTLPGREIHIPELAVDRAIPLLPAWSLVYGSLFLAAVLPAFVIHQQEHLRRTILAFLAIGSRRMRASSRIQPRACVPRG
ncbi:MAG TPA: hypothetical protein VM051_06485 [Usitatibacter sp.]|nr:hypothetical protein [Usitatibacter sp.]